MSDIDLLESDAELPFATGKLHCRTVRPASNPTARLLIIHGYGEHSGRYLHFMRWIAGRGISCQAVDLRGHGRAGGRRGFVREWDEYLLDVQAFLDWSRSPAGGAQDAPVFLLGHSHGGLISAAAGERGILASAKITGCILASPYLATRVPPPLAKRAFARAANHIVPWLRVRSNLRPEWLSADPTMLEQDRADELMNRSATPRWFLTMRYAQVRVRNEAAKFSLPLLCAAGEADVIADPSITADFYANASSADKSLYTYPSQRHELLRETGREKIFADIFGWISARS